MYRQYFVILWNILIICGSDALIDTEMVGNWCLLFVFGATCMQVLWHQRMKPCFSFKKKKKPELLVHFPPAPFLVPIFIKNNKKDFHLHGVTGGS